MKSVSKLLVCAAAVTAAAIALAQGPQPAVPSDPLGLTGRICHIGNRYSVKALRRKIGQDLILPTPRDATFYFCLAERMKRVGDYRAEEFYEKAIQADGKNPDYELFYADYLRNFRGAEAPLFPQAEAHYFKALAKIRDIPGGGTYPRSETDTGSLVERGLIALYQEDGVPLGYRDDESGRKPFAFFSTIDRYQQSPADLDREADVRDYTSEALYAGSQQPPLASQELRGLIRNKKAFETLDRIRLRYNTWPSIDVFYAYRQTDNAQITHFSSMPIDAPSNFNELRQNDFGITARKPLDLGSFDVNLTGTFRYVQRWGLVQRAADAHENIRQTDAKATLSRFVGPDKANLEFTYTHQWIQTALPNYPDREREFIGATATYQIFRPIAFLGGSAFQNRFETRGWNFFAGFLADNESFISPPLSFPPSSYPRRRDYFVGTSPKGMLWGLLDVTLRPTLFTSDVKGIPLQKNSQLRGDMTALFRIVDEEKHGKKGIPGSHPGQPGTHLGFIHLVGGFREDGALTGPDSYENHKWGFGLDSSFYTTGNRATYFLSARYDRERYFNLNRNADIVSARLSLGF